MQALRLIAWFQSLRTLAEHLAAVRADNLDAIGHEFLPHPRYPSVMAI
jgi:hypothetical protein